MSEFDTLNYAEYIYGRKNEGRTLLAKILMISLYVVFAGAFFLFCFLTRLIPVFAMCPLFLLVLVICTWRFVSYDYYFEFKSGTLELGAVRQKKSERKKFPKLTIHVKDAKLIKAYDEAVEDVKNIKDIYNFSASENSPHRIAVVFEKGGKECLAIFEGTAKVANLLASYCENGKSIKGQTFHG